MKLTKEITKEDIDRNYMLSQENKALDIPLHFLDGELKKKVNFEALKEYAKTDEGKAYYKANKDKINKRYREIYALKKVKIQNVRQSKKRVRY